MSENEIWDGLIRGDYKAFQNLYRTYFDQLYSYGLKLCHDKEQVEDAMHDLFLDIWKYHEKLSETTSAKFYLYRSLRRKIYKNQNRNQKETVFESEIELFYDNVSEGHDAEIIEEESEKAQNEKIKTVLKQLPARQYDALVLKFYSDFSYEEIGEMLDMNEQSARNLIQRGLQKMRKLLLFLLLAIGAIQFFINIFSS